jgi:DNA-3-methyladenine glycosylase II
LDWPFFLRYLGARATPGVEAAQDNRYVRTIETERGGGRFSVWHHPREARLIVSLQGDGEAKAELILARVRRIFDLDIDLTAVHAQLGVDAFLGPLVHAAPGIRIPGAWSAFELLVRTIVGQQVTVKAATTIMGRIVHRLGKPLRGAGDGEPSLLFPTPRELAEGSLESIGMPAKRAVTLQNVARAIAEGTIPFPQRDGDATAVKEALLQLPGIGPWTVEYFALRGLGEADAWPGTDLVLRRAVPPLAHVDAAWKPYRSYAAMHLWNRASQDKTQV